SAPADVIDIEIGSESGFFRPDSVTWKVMLSPTYVPGLLSILDLFEAFPPCGLMGAQSVTYQDPIGRSTRTLEYMLTLTFGDRDQAMSLIEHVNAMHDTIKCHWNGRDYCASDPENLLWLYVPFMQATMDAYDAYGPSRLTPEERDQMWREVEVIALLNRIPAEMIPTSQAEADKYFEEMRPRLAVIEESAYAHRLVFPLLWDNGIVPVALVPLVRLVEECATALTPDYVLKLHGQYRPAFVRRATIAAYRPLFRAMALTPGLRDALPRVAGEPVLSMVRDARARRAAVMRSSHGG
ncbi:oxygenase MpaB family protein, partial [Mycolicibacterium llatzerense]